MAVDLHVINFVGLKSPGRALSLISKDFFTKAQNKKQWKFIFKFIFSIHLGLFGLVKD